MGTITFSGKANAADVADLLSECEGIGMAVEAVKRRSDDDSGELVIYTGWRYKDGEEGGELELLPSMQEDAF